MQQQLCANRPLAIPEILVAVFEFLETDPSTLLVAIQVNKQWFACGTDVLWREAPCEVLTNIAEDRRQIYASKLTSLVFNGDDEASYHSFLKHLQFSSLQSISLDAYRPNNGSDYHIRQYFQPPLERFSFYGGDLDDNLLDHLRKICWRLRRILIDSPGEGVTASSFFRFISEYKSLEHMEFLHGMDHLLTDELLVHLAGRTNLSTLAIGKLWPERIIKRISTQISEPFTALQGLRMAVPSSAVPSLVQLIKHISRLHMNIRDVDIHVLQHISSVKHLRTLSLSFAVPTELPATEIMSLRTLSDLEELGIGPDEREEAAYVTAFDGFSDSDFEDFCSRFHRLRRIRFIVQCNLTAAALATLSRHCPLLEECTMPQMFDMHTLDLNTRKSPMFPNLRLLDLGGFQPPLIVDQERASSIPSPPAELASRIKRHCPKLEELYVSSDDEYSNDVADAFTTL